MSGFLDRIKLVDFPEDQYIREETPKEAIYLHHTASSANPFGVIEYWAGNDERVATSFIIAGPPPGGVTAWKDGGIYQAFSTKYWGYHLGLKAGLLPPKSKTTKHLNSHSIGIEICNWGELRKRPDGKFVSWSGSVVPDSQVLDLGYKYRAHQFWHKYTDAQIASVKDLLVFLCDKWKIPTDYKGKGMWDIDHRAFRGEPGIWTHTTVRSDKKDCSPQPNLIAMLESL